MHQISYRLGLRPRPHWGSLQSSPHWGSLQSSPDPLAGFKGPTSKGRQAKGKGRRGRKRRVGKGTCLLLMGVEGEKREEGREKGGREKGGGKGRVVQLQKFLKICPGGVVAVFKYGCSGFYGLWNKSTGWSRGPLLPLRMHNKIRYDREFNVDSKAECTA